MMRVFIFILLAFICNAAFAICPEDHPDNYRCKILNYEKVVDGHLASLYASLKDEEVKNQIKEAHAAWKHAAELHCSITYKLQNKPKNECLDELFYIRDIEITSYECFYNIEECPSRVIGDLIREMK